jgi:hypothetical protein
MENNSGRKEESVPWAKNSTSSPLHDRLIHIATSSDSTISLEPRETYFALLSVERCGNFLTQMTRNDAHDEKSFIWLMQPAPSVAQMEFEALSSGLFLPQ